MEEEKLGKSKVGHIGYVKWNSTYDKENLKLNCQHAHPSAQLPSLSVNDNPNWINFSISTLHRNVCKSQYQRSRQLQKSQNIHSLVVTYLILDIRGSKVPYRPSNNTRKLGILG